VPAVEQCRYRTDVQLTDDGDGDESARCGLLAEVIGCSQELAGFRVPRGACEKCVDGIPPSVDRLNPVLASFVYSMALEIGHQGGILGCDQNQAEELQHWAKSFVEVDVTRIQSKPLEKRSYRNCRHLGRVTGFQQQPSVGGLVRTAVHSCHHPNHDSTTESMCNACHDWSQTGTSSAKLTELLPRPRSWRGPSTIRWAVAVTTAPRRTPTLERSLESLCRAGWEDFQLAVDGSSQLPPTSTATANNVTVRAPNLGAWPNYYLTLLELVLGHGDADAYLMIQDDVQFYDRENVRRYLESILWPADTPGILSLYCSMAYTRERHGWATSEQSWQWGALAFVFPADLARRFVCDPEVIEHRFTDGGLRFIDDVIGEWAERNSIPIWFPSPSLVQHFGDTSTVWQGVPAAGFRRADFFAGDL
jgi:hypothetical protein